MDTPKHLIAIAASKNTAAFGNVICETAKKDALRWGALAAQRVRRYRPNTATDPEKTQVIIPGIMPADAMACNKFHDIRQPNQHPYLWKTYQRKCQHAYASRGQLFFSPAM